MFAFEEAQKFLSGNLGEVLYVSYEGTDISFRIERRCEESAEAYIPSGRGGYDADPFDIAMALDYPAHRFRFVLHENEYRVQIDSKNQLYAVCKIALNHFGWCAEKKLVKKYGGAVHK